MNNVLLIHNLPTPYRTELFNQVSQSLLNFKINFFVLFQVLTTKRRCHWKNASNQFNFDFEISRTFRIERLHIRIPIRPFKEFSEYSPSIIITSGFSLHSLFACVYSILHKIPLIVWAGEREITGNGKPIRLLLRKFILKHTSHMFIYGKASQIFYRKRFNFPPSRMTTLLNVIPVNHDIKVEEQIHIKVSELKKGVLKLIFVGDLVKRKGIYFVPSLLEHLAFSLSKYHIEMTIIGDGQQRDKFISRLRPLEEKLNIRYLGKIPNSQVLNEMASSHILLFPTLDDPWGHVLTEAISVGTPVLVSRFSGAVPDMLREGENGFVVDFSKPVRIVEIVSHMINNQEKYHEICKSSKKSYETVFKSLRNSETMAGVILNLLGKNI